MLLQYRGPVEFLSLYEIVILLHLLMCFWVCVCLFVRERIHIVFPSCQGTGDKHRGVGVDVHTLSPGEAEVTAEGVQLSVSMSPLRWPTVDTSAAADTGAKSISGTEQWLTKDVHRALFSIVS